MNISDFSQCVLPAPQDCQSNSEIFPNCPSKSKPSSEVTLLRDQGPALPVEEECSCKISSQVPTHRVLSLINCIFMNDLCFSNLQHEKLSGKFQIWHSYCWNKNVFIIQQILAQYHQKFHQFQILCLETELWIDLNKLVETPRKFSLKSKIPPEEPWGIIYHVRLELWTLYFILEVRCS